MTGGSVPLTSPRPIVVPQEIRVFAVASSLDGEGGAGLEEKVKDLGEAQAGEAPKGEVVKTVRKVKRLKKEKKVGFLGRLFGGGSREKLEEKMGRNRKMQTEEEVGDQRTFAQKVAKKAEEEFSLPRRVTGEALVTKRHEELMTAVNEICGMLEKAQEREPQAVEVKLSEVLPPMPSENLEVMARTQEKVGEALERVAGTLEDSVKRERLLLDSLTRVDGTLADLSRASEKSVTTMDGMKGVFAQVNGGLEALQTEIRKSGRRYEDLWEKVQKADEDKTAMIAKLQKRTLLVTGLVGVAVVVALLVFVFGRSSF